MLLWTLHICIFWNWWFFWIFLYIYPGVVLLGHMVVVFLVFWGNSVLFFTVVAPIYIPINCVWGLPFLYILANIHHLCAIWQVWGDNLIVVFNLNFFDNVEHLFKCLLSIFTPSLEKSLFGSSAHFLLRLFVCLMLSYVSCLYILHIKPYQQIFSLIQ